MIDRTQTLAAQERIADDEVIPCKGTKQDCLRMSQKANEVIKSFTAEDAAAVGISIIAHYIARLCRENNRLSLAHPTFKIVTKSITKHLKQELTYRFTLQELEAAVQYEIKQFLTRVEPKR